MHVLLHVLLAVIPVVVMLASLPVVVGEDLDNFHVYSDCVDNSWTIYVTDSDDNPLSDVTVTAGDVTIHLDNTGIFTAPLNTSKVILEKQGFATQTLNTNCPDSDIPSWVKNIIVLWSTNQITDDEFKNSLTYLIDQGIIRTETKTQYHQLLIENLTLKNKIQALEEEKNQCLEDLNTPNQCEPLQPPTIPPVEQPPSAVPPINAEPISVIFINLEKAGESILVITPDDNTMLIDGGLKSSFDNLSSVLREYDVDVIDVMVSTHPDQDHVSGLINVLESNRFDVGEVWISPIKGTTKTYQSFLNEVSSNGLTAQVATTGQDIMIDSLVDVSVLSPPSDGVPGAKNDKNENSVIIHMEYGEVSFLFTGDAEEHAEEFLIRNPIDINIMNGPHHGSKGSSTPEFIRAFDPEVVIFSADHDNRYGHPHDEVKSRYLAYDSSIGLYQTGVDGNILVETDGVRCTLTVQDASPKPCYLGIEMLP